MSSFQAEVIFKKIFKSDQSLEIVSWIIILTAFVPWVIYCYIWLFLQLKIKIGRFSIRMGEIPKFGFCLLLISPFVAIAMVGICYEDLTDFIKNR